MLNNNQLNLFQICFAVSFISVGIGCRKRLFNMINDLPTVFEVVTGASKKQEKEKSSVSNQSGNKSKSNSKPVKLTIFLPFTHLEDIELLIHLFKYMKFLRQSLPRYSH